MDSVKKITYSITSIGKPLVTVDVQTLGPVKKLYFSSFSMRDIQKGLDLRKIAFRAPVVTEITPEFKQFLVAGGLGVPETPFEGAQTPSA